MQVSRVNLSKRAAQSAYDRMSHLYDWLAGSSETRLIHQGIELLAVSPGESVPEIGCGTGKALVEFCNQAGDQAVACGLDLSQGMVKVASSRLWENAQSRNA
jgi:ubiquinone/menaquinone biosynthesis C-methylase UbiE